MVLWLTKDYPAGDRCARQHFLQQRTGLGDHR